MSLSEHAHRNGSSVRSAEQNGSLVRPISVVLVNDYEIIVHGLAAMLAPFCERVAVVDREVADEPDCQADVALFDTFGGHRSAIERAGRMVADADIAHVVFYTWERSADFLRDAELAGVHGVIPKETPAADVVAQLERIVCGERLGFESRDGQRHLPGNGTYGGSTDEWKDVLSEREREVLALVALGRSNKQIANELYLSVETVRTYVRRLYGKLGVRNRAQAAVHATLNGVAPPPGIT